MKTCKNCKKINSDSRKNCFQCNEPLSSNMREHFPENNRQELSNAMMYANGVSAAIGIGMLSIFFGGIFMSSGENNISFATGASITFILLAIVVYFYERNSESKITLIIAITGGMIMTFFSILYMM